MSYMAQIWSLADGGDAESLNKALMIAMKKKVLTSMSSKGYAPVGRNRKSSIGENMQLAFVHLRILDVCKGMLLKQKKVEMHQICYEVLSADAETADAVLGMHKKEAGDFPEAAQHYRKAAVESKLRNDKANIIPFNSSCLECCGMVDEPSDRLKLVQMSALLDSGVESCFNSDLDGATRLLAKSSVMGKAHMDALDPGEEASDERRTLIAKNMLSSLFPPFLTKCFIEPDPENAALVANIAYKLFEFCRDHLRRSAYFFEALVHSGPMADVCGTDTRWHEVEGADAWTAESAQPALKEFASLPLTGAGGKRTSTLDVRNKFGTLYTAKDEAAFLQEYLEIIVGGARRRVHERVDLAQWGFAEIEQLFERAVDEANFLCSPLMVAFALKELKALHAASSAKGAAAQSRYEESLFDLTMDRTTPLRIFLESE